MEANEFTIETDDLVFLIEVNRTTKDSNVFLFCKLLFDKRAHAKPCYFFMEKNKKDNWEIVSRFTVPQLILKLEANITEKIGERIK